MKKIVIIAVALLFGNACTDDFEEINVNPKAATEVPVGTLLSSAQRELTDVLTSANVNVNIFRLLTQQWAQTTYTDESRYDLVTRDIPTNIWTILYRDVLADLREAQRLILAETNAPDAIAQNRLAILEIHEIYAWTVLVNIFGDVPYTEALDPDNVYPAYDDAEFIYNDLLERLDAAIALLNPDAPGFGSADLIYGGVGSVESWLTFANSLKLKLAMTIAEVAPDRAEELVQEALPNVFTSNLDNATFNYLAAPPNTNPIWIDLVQSGRQDFVVANTLVDVMLELDDPRLEQYFSLVNNEIIGGTYGTSNSFASFSKPSARILAPDFEAVLLSYSEVEFYLAEAAVRGFDVPGTAEEHYENAIVANMEYWNVPPEEIAEYLQQPAVTWDPAAANPIQQIALQKWIALYNRGYDAWVEWRRLDYPVLPIPADAYLDAIPVRFPYPTVEQNLNTENYNAAAAAIGGDLPSTRIFWDVD
ncbi:SusD/RagB family nutrient-binding outer membrane lipoprotein [Pontibacter ummariensis]|nr:SusD/RagB family nutrient-binding outer membrane lipoprotein [Pontibacter ummariensis]